MAVAPFLSGAHADGQDVHAEDVLVLEVLGHAKDQADARVLEPVLGICLRQPLGRVEGDAVVLDPQDDRVVLVDDTSPLIAPTIASNTWAGRSRNMRPLVT